MAQPKPKPPEVDRKEWILFASEQMHDWGKCARIETGRTLDSFRGLSPYDLHEWYIASKSIVNTLYWLYGSVNASNWLEYDDVPSPAYLIRKLAAYRALIKTMLQDLEGHCDNYQVEHDVKAGPELLIAVQSHATAFLTRIEFIINQAPAELQVLSKA